MKASLRSTKHAMNNYPYRSSYFHWRKILLVKKPVKCKQIATRFDLRENLASYRTGLEPTVCPCVGSDQVWKSLGPFGLLALLSRRHYLLPPQNLVELLFCNLFILLVMLHSVRREREHRWDAFYFSFLLRSTLFQPASAKNVAHRVFFSFCGNRCTEIYPRRTKRILDLSYERVSVFSEAIFPHKIRKCECEKAMTKCLRGHFLSRS